MVQEFLDSLQSIATTRTFKKSSVILYQGEAPRMAYVVKTGVIKVYTINNAGEEQIVTMHGPGDIFPAPWIFKKTTVTLYYYETLAPCEIMTIGREELRELMFKPANLPNVVDYLSASYAGLLMRITALEQSRAGEKIMFTLYYLCMRYGRQTKPGIYEIALPLTHNTIASLVGLTRETTTTELNRLKKQKAVRYGHHIYTVDKARLERMLGEDSFKNLSL